MRIATIIGRSDGATALAVAREDSPFVAVPEALARVAAPDDADRLFRPEGNLWLTGRGRTTLADLLDAAVAAGVPAVDWSAWRLAPPVPQPGKIIAAGRNYMDHVREGQEIWAKRGKVVNLPEFPTAFTKYTSSLTAHEQPLLLPVGIDDVDYEIELAVVIGETAFDVPEETALSCVAGYTICNDAAARGIQRREMEAQIGISMAKNFPTFGPMGPWMVTADAIPDPQTLDIRLDVDGDTRQHANTADMIFSVARLVSYWSRLGLFPGDVIITGTPSGVALARPEPEKYYLRPGQTVTATIERIGSLVNPVARAGTPV